MRLQTKKQKEYLKKLGCLVCCLCLTASLWGCKVETVEQHQQRVSSIASQAESSQNHSIGSKESSSKASSQKGDSSSASQITAESQKEAASEGVSSVSQNDGEAPAVSSREAQVSSQPSVSSGGGSPQVSSAPSESQPEPEPETITVTISVLCPLAVGNPNLNPGISLPSDGVMVSGLSLELAPGQTAFDALKQTGLPLDYSGSPSRKNVYLRGINGLYERDCGPSSGWVFSVNGTYPNTSCSKITLNDGDTVSFQFTDGTKLN